jgi:mRNA interferase RelE/StbE
MYNIRLLKAASRELEAMDKTVAMRIATRLRWLAENVEHIRPLTLKGDLSGLCKLREGDYRIIYAVIHDEMTIIIHAIGHRRDVYR